MIKLHKYVIGQVWLASYGRHICIAAVSGDDQSMVAFPYDPETNEILFTQLLATVSSELDEYVGIITNSAAIREIESNYRNRYAKLLSEVRPKYIRNVMESKLAGTSSTKLSRPRGHKPHHIGVYCPEVDMHFYSMRECDRHFNLPAGHSKYAIKTQRKLLNKYTLITE